MTTQPLARLLGRVQKTLAAHREADADLLARYRESRDPDALDALVRKHAPLVLAACRKVLPDSDADAMGIPALVPHRVPAYRYENGWLNCHYVRGYVTRAVAAGDHQLSPRELAAMDVFASLGNHPDVLIEMLLEPGDFQIFNNRTVLHGRAQFEDYPEKARRRHLKRLWLSVDDWPKLPELQRPLYGENLWKWQEHARKAVVHAPTHASLRGAQAGVGNMTSR